MQKYENKKNSLASSSINSYKKGDNSKQNIDSNWHSNYLSFSSKQTSDAKKPGIKSMRQDDAVPISLVKLQGLDTKENIWNDDIEAEWNFNDTKLLERITPIKNNYFNNKMQWSPNWVNTNDKDEISFSKNKHRMIDYQTKAFEEWDNHQTESVNTNKSWRETLKENNNFNRWRLSEFDRSNKNTPVDEEIIEKYWNILSQKTYTSKEWKERNSLLKTTNDGEFPKEANKTMLNINKSEWNLTSRRVSHARSKKNELRANDWKSARRNSSK